MVPSTIRSKKA